MIDIYIYTIGVMFTPFYGVKYIFENKNVQIILMNSSQRIKSGITHDDEKRIN